MKRMKLAIIAGLKEDDHGYTKDNSCAVLKAHKEVRGEVVALCAP